MAKNQKQSQKFQEERQKKQYESLKQKMLMERNEEQKAKIRMYKDYKAQQIMELKLREQGVMLWGGNGFAGGSQNLMQHDQVISLAGSKGSMRRNN